MAQTTIENLRDFGQSIWLDNISCSLIASGKLKALLAQGLSGVTSNPTIFDKAISQSKDYDETIAQLHRKGKSVFEVYDDLTISDVQAATDIFRPLYEKTNKLDGYVSLEINPKLARLTQDTIEEGKRLWKKVNRPNLMLKVPATEEGFGAIEALLAQGMNVNATLIFSLEQYIKTAQAFLKGMRRLADKGARLSDTHSVASVFVSRTDTAIDASIEQLIKNAPNQEEAVRLQSLRGKAAVSNCGLIYGKFLEIYQSPEWKQLEDKGASLQRIVWASTSSKNPRYSDIKYVSELISQNTVNTVPDTTLEAFLDHGIVKEALTKNITPAAEVIRELKALTIDINEVCAKLLNDGVIAFEKSFDSLLASIEEKAKAQSAMAV